MQISIKSLVTPSIPLAILLSLGCFVLWGISFSNIQPAPNLLQSYASQIDSFVATFPLVANLIALAFTIFNAFLLSQLNNQFTIIRSRTFLPTLLFLLLLACWPAIHTHLSTYIILTLTNLSLFYFLRMTRNRNASEEAFMGSLLLSCCSIISNPIILLIPICWIGFLFFQSLSLRTFLASLFGSIAPWILFLVVYIALTGDLYFYKTLDVYPVFSYNFQNYPIQLLIYAGIMIAVMIISLINLSSLAIGDSIHTRNKLNFLIFFLITISVISFLYQNQFTSFLPIIALIYSLLISHPLTLKNNNFNSILFIVFIIANVGFVISNLILSQL